MLLALALLAIPQFAQAGSKESDERAAKTACLTGDYAKGVAILTELYISTGNITFLFNQGRCFEQNGKYEEAIVRFREYQLKNVDAGNAPDAETDKHIATCQTYLQPKHHVAAPAQTVERPIAPAVSPVPSPTVAESTFPQPAPAATHEPASEPTREPVETPAANGHGLRVSGIVGVALGVAGIATGVALNLKANSLANQLEAANGSSTTLYSRSKESSRSTYRTLGWTAYGTGAACLVGGAILYWVGTTRRQNTPSAFVPMVAVGQAGVAWQGAF